MKPSLLERLGIGGGRHAGLSPTVRATTTGAPHVRDAINLDTLMRRVLLALVPCVLFGLYNTGLQAIGAVDAADASPLPGWRGALSSMLAGNGDTSSVIGCTLLGLGYFLPVYFVTLAVGELWQRLFAGARERPTTAGFSVTALLFALSLPPTIPLWQVALGISFGLVIGREIFGGTGRNPFNPALTGLAFLYFAYPATLAAPTIWVAVDGWSGATSLALATSGGIEALRGASVGWWQTFVGLEAGAPGETSALACLVGATLLLYWRIISWRVLVGGVAGLSVTAMLFAVGADGEATLSTLPWHWHLTLGGFAFGLVFFATDPVSSAATQTGRWIYGAFIGAATVVIRVANPAHTEGVMLAILLGNILAPLIDHVVIRANVRRREARGEF